jgi:hypothetical protein
MKKETSLEDHPVLMALNRAMGSSHENSINSLSWSYRVFSGWLRKRRLLGKP